MFFSNRKKHIRFFYYAIVLILIIKIFILDVKYVKGNSMQPALNDGNLIFILKAAYGIKIPFKNFYILRWKQPQQNDIVVFLKNGHFTVKRCAGNSNQTIEFMSNLRYNGGLNYAMKTSGKIVALTGTQFRNLGGMSETKSVPAGTVLVLGDNLNDSYDSRDYGFILIDGIIGKVILWK